MLSTTRLSLKFKNKPVINGVQKNIIEGTLKFIFDEIAQLKPLDALFVLDSILLFDSTDEFVKSRVRYVQKQLSIRDNVINITNILLHKFPQNRFVGDASATGDYQRYPDGVKNGIVYYWKKGFGSEIGSEPQGMLGLTARNDSTAHAITADAVKTYILQLIQVEIKKHQERAEYKDELVLSSKICRFDIQTLFGKRNLRDWISLENKEYCEWIKSDKIQIIYGHTLYLQLVFGLALYIEEQKVKKKIYVADPIIDQKIDFVVDSITDLFNHQRLQNRVDTPYRFNLTMLNNVLFSEGLLPRDVFAEINKSLSTLKLSKEADLLPIEIDSHEVCFNFTLREIGKHVVTNLANWRQMLLTPSLPATEALTNTMTKPVSSPVVLEEKKEGSKEEKRIVGTLFSAGPPGGPAIVLAPIAPSSVTL